MVHCRFNIGISSVTLAQHPTNIAQTPYTNVLLETFVIEQCEWSCNTSRILCNNWAKNNATRKKERKIERKKAVKLTGLKHLRIYF